MANTEIVTVEKIGSLFFKTKTELGRICKAFGASMAVGALYAIMLDQFNVTLNEDEFSDLYLALTIYDFDEATRIIMRHQN